MERRWIAIFSVGFLALCYCSDATSQRIAEQNTPKSANQLQPSLQPIATGKHRISRDSQTITIFQGNQDIKVDYFTEFVIGTMIAKKVAAEKLEGETISLAQDAGKKDRWIIFHGALGGDILTLAENEFRVQKVLTSTAQNPVKIQTNDKVYRLQPGEVLLLLG
jgi:hypothetical protein